jgi:transglutaminase-like putative cysteine protease
LNSNGKRYGKESLLENEFIKIKDFKVEIHDLEGNTLRKAEDEDFKETSISQDASLYDDTRYRLVDLGWSKIPYVIDIEYSLEINSLFFWPDWYPQYDIPVKESRYKVILNESVEFETYPIGMEIEPVITGNVYLWSLNDIPPLHREDWAPPESKVQMALLFAPRRFEYGKSIGFNSSWNSFILWYIRLIGKSYSLAAEYKETVTNLTVDVQSNREKLSILYEYLQHNTRYVSISLGVGGHKPQTAASVCKNRYGDCKDLSTLMVAMAREVGIEAYPVLIRTRDEGIVHQDFPSNQFNHVIALALVDGDSIWIECTADNLPLGELPPNDEGCRVLVINPEVQKLVTTPSSRSDENKIVSSAKGSLLNDGTFLFAGSIQYSGNCALNRRHNLLGEPLEKQIEWVAGSVLGKYTPQVKLDSCSFENVEDQFGYPISCNFKGLMNKFGLKSSKRLFFNPAYLHRQTPDDLPDETEREFPVSYNYAFTYIDTLHLTIPSNYLLEAAPEQVDLQANFGQYIMSYMFNGQSMTYVRKLKIDERYIQPEDYTEYRSFLQQAIKTDNTKFVLKKMF